MSAASSLVWVWFERMLVGFRLKGRSWIPGWSFSFFSSDWCLLRLWPEINKIRQLRGLSKFSRVRNSVPVSFAIKTWELELPPLRMRLRMIWIIGLGLKKGRTIRSRTASNSIFSAITISFNISSYCTFSMQKWHSFDEKSLFCLLKATFKFDAEPRPFLFNCAIRGQQKMLCEAGTFNDLMEALLTVDKLSMATWLAVFHFSGNKVLTDATVSIIDCRNFGNTFSQSFPASVSQIRLSPDWLWSVLEKPTSLNCTRFWRIHRNRGVISCILISRDL